MNSINSSALIPQPPKTAIYSAYINPPTEASQSCYKEEKIQGGQVLKFMASIQPFSELLPSQFLLLCSFHFSIQLYNDAKNRLMTNENTFHFFFFQACCSFSSILRPGPVCSVECKRSGEAPTLFSERSKHALMNPRL